MLRSALLVTLGLLCCPAMAAENDRDGDGILDSHEEILGSDPGRCDVFHTILDDGRQPETQRRRPGYDATKDVTKVEFGHAGGNRYLWRVTFAEPPRPENTVLHLYVDADANPNTGRKSTPGGPVHGTDYMLSVVGGQGTSQQFTADGLGSAGPVVSFVVQGNALILSADVELGRNAEGIAYGLYVLCHTATADRRGPTMSDSSRRFAVSGIRPVDRPKIVRPIDYTENFQVQACYGIQRLHEVLLDKANLVVPHDQLQLADYEVDMQTSNRFAHVSRTARNGRVWTAAPKAGRYHVGFMMFDDSNDERVSLWIEGKLQGIAIARQDNNRTWLYWLAEPYAFRGGERVELRAFGPSGKHGICNILFLATPPTPRGLEYRAENLAAAAQVGQAGRVTVSWTTTLPTTTCLEYGRDAKYGHTAAAETRSLVHRVVIDGLDPKVEYHGRAVGRTREGAAFYSADFSFRADPPVPPATREGVTSVPIGVRNPYPFAIQAWAVATGVPMPQAALADVEHVRLVGAAGEVPAQVSLAARWTDGSVKWLLVRFQADAPAKGEAAYRLEFGRGVTRMACPGGLSVEQRGGGVRVDTGALRLLVDRQGNLCDLGTPQGPRLRTGEACRTVAVTQKLGALRPGKRAEVTVEEAGPLRVVVKTVSTLADAKGVDQLRIEKRIEAYRGQALLRVHHTLVVVAPEKFLDLGSLAYRVPLAQVSDRWTAPLAAGGSATLDSAAPRLWQRFDNELVAAGADGEKPRKGRIVGSLLAAGPGGGGVALRELWQNYPAGFSASPTGVDVELCPAFAAGAYDRFPFEKEGNQLYYYLLGGRYRLKQGVAKTHELLLCFAPQDRSAELAQLFQQPPLATAAAEWYCRSKAFYDVAPRNVRRFKLYEEAIDKNVKAYAAARDRAHDYGLLNYGDWFGERGANWGNEEYDTQHAFFLEYIRSGNADAFRLGHATELHNRDVDTIHWSPKADAVGGVYIHQMSHVGGYWDKSVEGTLAFPSGGCSVTHAWAEGHFDHYFLTGDRRSYETACEVSDYFIEKELGRPYDFLSCREPGWHLIMLAAAYAATGDPYYLNASRVVVDRVLETQDRVPRPLPACQAAGRKPYQLGTWSRMLVPGHCTCEPRHRGNAGFMVAVLLSGLKYFHDVTGDPRVKECIILGAQGLVEETYSDETQGFRYTSCPNTRYTSGASPLMVEGIARAYLWTKDERFRRVLTEALPRGAGGSSYGKGFSMYYRMAPRVLADLEAAGLKLDAK
jgi:hypothetical protein